MFWADGILRIDQLRGYQRAGFNTVVVRLTWPPSQDGQIAAADLSPQRHFAEAAASLGLNIIYSLPPAPFGEERSFSISSDGGPYRLLWSNWTQAAIKDLRDTPNLIGWMLPDDPRSLPFTGNASFGRWLAANYSGIQVLNQQWGTSFQSFEEVRLSVVRQLVGQSRGPVAMPEKATPEQMQAWIMESRRRTNQNYAFHPAELSLAHYKWDTYRALLDFWAKTVRNADPARTIFAGRLPDYAQLLSLPASVDVSLPAISPAWAEKDIGSHNPQAVAVARRGGRFQAVAMLSTALPDAPEDLVPRLVSSWCDAALASGARGIAFDNWIQLVEQPQLRLAVRNSLLRLQSAEYSALWGQAPQATAAIVLTPLADGHTWRPQSNLAPGTEALPPLGGQEIVDNTPPRGLFGFGEDMVPGEPSDLVYALRWGTLFGNVDFLSPDELGGAYSAMTGGALKRYSVVLMPQAFSVPPQMAQELANYIAAGGTVVADLGVGAWQSGAQVLSLSESLQTIFGVIPTGLRETSFNLKGATPHPLLPTWSAMASTHPQAMTRGDGPQGAAFAGPTVFAELTPGTVPLALGFQMPQQLGNDRNERGARSGANNGNSRESESRVRVSRSWLTLRPFGQGNAIFAPFRLWNLWRPGYPGFDQFHGDLLARNAQLVHLNAESLVPSPPGSDPGSAYYPQAVNFPNAIALINHNAAVNPPYATWTPLGDAAHSEAGAIMPTREEVAKQITAALATNPKQPAIVQTAGVEQFLWSNALCLFPVGAAPTPTMGRYPPVPGFGAVGGDAGFVVPPTAHPVILHSLVPAQEMRVLRMLPIRAMNPASGPLASRVREYSPRRIEMRIWPNAQSAMPGNDDWRVAIGAEGIARVTVFDHNAEGSYRIAPGTRHRVAITEVHTEGGKSTTTTNYYVLGAASDGSLGFEIRGRSLRVEIWPVDAPITPEPAPRGSTPVPGGIVPDNPPAIVPDHSPGMLSPPPGSSDTPPMLSPPPGTSTPVPEDSRRERREDEPKEEPDQVEDNTSDGTLFRKRYRSRFGTPEKS